MLDFKRLFSTVDKLSIAQYARYFLLVFSFIIVTMVCNILEKTFMKIILLLCCFSVSTITPFLSRLAFGRPAPIQTLYNSPVECKPKKKFPIFSRKNREKEMFHYRDLTAREIAIVSRREVSRKKSYLIF